MADGEEQAMFAKSVRAWLLALEITGKEIEFPCSVQAWLLALEITGKEVVFLRPLAEALLLGSSRVFSHRPTTLG